MTDQSDPTYRPPAVTPPGSTLADVLEERGIKQNELAVRLGVTAKFINELILGKVSITPKTALLLERALSVPADFWLARDAHYQASLIRAQSVGDLEAQRDWLHELPLKEMETWGWVSRGSTAAARVAECFRFFAVASVDAWRDQYAKRVAGSAAWRMSSQGTQAEGAVSAWLRQGEIEAARCRYKPYDKNRLLAALPRVRELTLEADPEKFIPLLQQVFGDCGVVVAFIRAPKGCPASGAVRWLAPEKALIQLSLRYRTNDHLWFTLFHECAHLLLHAKKMLFLEVKDMNDKDEDEANKFAANWLVPQEKFDEFCEGAISRLSIIRFAEEIGIAAGIVVGRLQKEERISWAHHNDLKIRYAWNEA
jgi:addiction module HigA family antidote